MTDKRYLYESALQGRATVTATGERDGVRWVKLDRTWFHPQGGGQKSDRGTIGDAPVVRAIHTEDGDVEHQLSATPGFAVGDAVEVAVDADWRTICSRLHTAGHLIAAVVEELFPALHATTGHHWPGEARVEFDGQPLPEVADVQRRLSPALTEALTAGMEVSRQGDPLVERTIVIGRFPPMGCGGTHVRSLREVGQVVVRSVKAKGGKLRIGYEVV